MEAHAIFHDNTITDVGRLDVGGLWTHVQAYSIVW